MTLYSKPINVDEVICLLERKLFIQTNLVEQLTEKFDQFEISHNKDTNRRIRRNADHITKSTG